MGMSFEQVLEISSTNVPTPPAETYHVSSLSQPWKSQSLAVSVKGHTLLLKQFRIQVLKRHWGVQATPGTDLKCGHYALSQSLASRAQAYGSLGTRSPSVVASAIFSIFETFAAADGGDTRNISAFDLQQRLKKLHPSLVLAVARDCGECMDGVRFLELGLTHSEDFERLKEGAEVLFIHNRKISEDMNHWEGIGPCGNVFVLVEMEAEHG